MKKALAWVLGGLLPVSVGMAQEEGDRLFDANLYVRSEYNSNLYLSPIDPSSDVLFYFQPEISSTLVTLPATFKLRYAPSFSFPVDRFSDDRLRRIMHIGEFDAISEMASGLKLHLNDEIALLPRNFGTPDNQTSGLVQTNRALFVATETLALSGQTELEISGRAGRFDVWSAPGSRQDFGGTLRTVREFSGNFQLGISGSALYEKFDDLATNYWTYRVNLEPKYQITPRLKAEVPTGIQWILFSAGTTNRDITTDAELTYELTEDQTLQLAYRQSFTSDASGDSFRLRQGSFTGGMPISSRLKAELTVVYGWFEEMVPDPITAVTSKQVDTLLTIRPALWYTFNDRWSFNAGYSFSMNRGEFSSNDYEANLFFIGLAYSLWGT